MKPKVIALTGGIGSGKSVVAKRLRDCHFDTVDCDEIVSEIAKEIRVIGEVGLLLGPNSIRNGELNKEYIRETVFRDVNLLNEYQTIFHKRMKKRIEQCVKNCKAKALFVEIPVLDAFQFDWDEVWKVVSDVEIRVQRVTSRDNVSEQNTRDIISRQKDYDCERTIVNNGSLEELGNSIYDALLASDLITL